MDCEEIFEDTINARQTIVYDIIRDGSSEKRVINRKATIAAQSKQAELKTAFESWVWKDDERADRLARIYNQTFNIWRRRKYNGSHLTIPGLSKEIQPWDNQKNAVWRILQSQTTLLDHEVGSGKTLTCIIAAMESIRLGLARKAIIVVPNHLTGQWAAKVQEAYPQVRCLSVTSKDLNKSSRGTFLSRISTGDFQIIIVPFSSFKLLPVSLETEIKFIEEQIAELENYLWELKQEDGASAAAAIKQIAKAKKRFEAKLNAKKEMAKDSRETVTFEMLGCDFLCIDEFSAYKNLFYTTKMTRIAGLSNSESQRSFDMFIKILWIIEHQGRVVSADGTPITNTIAEVYTMIRYMNLSLLREKGIACFDAWAAQFALAEPGLEMTPDGGGFRINTRFRKFVNLPELISIWSLFTDSYRIEDGGQIERPDLFGNGVVKVKVRTDPRLRPFIKSLSKRAEMIHKGNVAPEIDNMLKITSEGRKAALDMSLVIPGDPNGPMNKIDAMVDTIFQVYNNSQPTHGVQLVFCDLATPKPKRQ